MNIKINIPVGTIHATSYWDHSLGKMVNGEILIRVDEGWIEVPTLIDVVNIGNHIINYDAVQDHDGNSADDPLPQLNPYESSTDSPFDGRLDLDLDNLFDDPFNAPTIPNAQDPTRKQDHFCRPGMTMINGKRICKICGRDLD